MNELSQELAARCGLKCELCGSDSSLSTYIVPPKSGDHIDEQLALCGICTDFIENPDKSDVAHWRCLNDSIWSPVPAVQVVSFRMLQRLSDQSWAQDLSGMVYLDDQTREWAENTLASGIIHKDSNGNILNAGDTVVLIKDLDVKGANFTAKRGTAVRRISLVHDNPEQIEGRVNDQHIVILTKYVKKSL